MKEDFVACPEVSGKTVVALKIFRDTGDGNECQIEFTDGTSFNLCFGVKPTIEANLIRPGVGEPEKLHRYEVD